MRNRLPRFVGYPLKREALLVPCVLLLCVVVSANRFSALSILSIITLCALVVSITILVIRHGLDGMASQLSDHVTTYLPKMVGELSLFLSAGVFAVGVAALLETGLIASPFTRFDGATAAQLLGWMLFAAVIGIHPIILISSITPMVLTLDPNPTLLAIVYLTAWHLGTCSSYLSGVQLVFQGRYGIVAWQSAIRNWPYAFVAYLIACAWLWMLSTWLPLSGPWADRVSPLSPQALTARALGRRASVNQGAGLRLRRTNKLDGIIVNAIRSSTSSPPDIGSKSKWRQNIDNTMRISSSARLRPGHRRGPAPNGMNAWR